MKRILALIVALPLALAGCDAPPETIAGKIMEKVELACAFKADYAWLTDVIVKADITAQMVDELATQICTSVIAARTEPPPLSLYSNSSKRCMWGEIEVNGEKVCIEGAPVEEGK